MTTGAAASRSDEPVGSGFDLPPRRPVAVTIVLFLVVVTGAAVFAHVFRETALIVLDWLTDADGPVAAARTLHPVVLCVLVSGSVAIVAAVGLAVDRRWRSYVGVEAVAASARGEARRISLRASMLRAAATWLMSMGPASVGRESAIIETAGAAGSVSARRLGGKGDAMAAAGIAAAFAAAYHAPVASLLYVEEHLGVRRSRRAVLFAFAGAFGGQFATVWLFDVHPIFPRVQGPRWQLVAPALVALVPSVLAARLFLQLRVRLNGRAISDRFGVHRGLVRRGVQPRRRGRCGCVPARRGQRHGGAPLGRHPGDGVARPRVVGGQADRHHGDARFRGAGWCAQPVDGHRRWRRPARVAGRARPRPHRRAPVGRDGGLHGDRCGSRPASAPGGDRADPRDARATTR